MSCQRSRLPPAVLLNFLPKHLVGSFDDKRKIPISVALNGGGLSFAASGYIRVVASDEVTDVLLTDEYLVRETRSTRDRYNSSGIEIVNTFRAISKKN